MSTADCSVCSARRADERPRDDGVRVGARAGSFRRCRHPTRGCSGSPTTPQVLAHCYWQPDRAARPTLLALHGLEGSSEAHYMRGLADKAWRRGWNAVLLNQRNCGGTEHLTPGLYHSGLTADPRAVIRELVESDGSRRSASSATRSAAISRSSWPASWRRTRTAGARGRRRQPDDRSRALRARDRAPRQHRLSVELRAQPPGPHAPQGAGVAAALRPGAARPHLDDSPVRRRLHGATPRIRRRDELLRPSQRHA